MAQPPPNPAKTPPGAGSPATAHPNQATKSSTDPIAADMVSTVASNGDTVVRRALFSTELCTFPPRKASGPPFPPMVVRSDPIAGVVDAARYWQKKFPRYCMGIFPGCDWTIEDFWDEQDIQLDGAKHYREVLKFISQENFFQARHYAEEWSRAYPDRVVNIVALTHESGMYDGTNPLSIVDKLFNNGETDHYPRQFLWHVANIMRTTMVEVSKKLKPSKGAAKSKEKSPVGSQDSAAKGDHPPANASSRSQSSERKDTAPTKSKTNRKKKHSRSRNLTKPLEAPSELGAQPPAPTAQLSSEPMVQAPASAERPSTDKVDQALLATTQLLSPSKDQAPLPTKQTSSETVIPAPMPAENQSTDSVVQAPVSPGAPSSELVIQETMPATEPSVPSQLDASLATRPAVVSGPPQTVAEHSHSVEGGMSNLSTSPHMANVMSEPYIQNPKVRSHHPIQATYQQPIPTGHWAENMSRGSSGTYVARPPSGSLGGMHPDHGYPPPFMGLANPMQQFIQGPPGAPASFHPGQPYHGAMSAPGMMVPQAMSFPGPPMIPGHIQQPYNTRGGRGASFGEVANNGYYASTMPLQHPDTRRTSLRQPSFHNNAALYDPYNGTNPAFMDHKQANKPPRHGLVDTSGRQRKSSALTNRPGRSSSGADRSNYTYDKGRRQTYTVLSKGNLEDDPFIVGDELNGCGHNWIGPMNGKVNELYISDLKENANSENLQHLIHQEIKILPTNVDVRRTPKSERLHAFVSFNTPSDAKVALDIYNKSGLFVRGLPCHVTVPRRFFKKRLDYDVPQEPRQVESKASDGHNVHRGGRRLSDADHDRLADAEEPKTTEAFYSPQDARSDLQNKTLQESTHALLSITGSPETRQMKARKSSPLKGSTNEENQPAADLLDAVHPSITATAVKANASSSGIAKDSCSGEVGETKEHSSSAETVKSAGHSITPSMTAEKTAGKSGDQSTSLKITQPVQVEPKDNSRPPVTVTLPEEASEIEHQSVPSQTKSDLILQSSTLVVQTTKPPSTPSVSALQTKQVEDGGHDLVSDNANTMGIGARSKEEPLTEDDEDADATFTSASEEISRVKSPVIAQEWLVLTSQGADRSGESARKDSSTTVSSSVACRELTNGSPQTELPISSDSNDAHTRALITTKADVSDSKQDSALATAIQTTTAESASKQVLVGKVKKSGPQITPSLNPFAKPTKAQRQKEKELKKRERKKEQGEKMAKAKAAKAIASDAFKVVSSSGAGSQQRQDSLTDTCEGKGKGTSPVSDGQGLRQSNNTDDLEHKSSKHTKVSAQISASKTAPEVLDPAPSHKQDQAQVTAQVFNVPVEAVAVKEGDASTIKKPSKTVPTLPDIKTHPHPPLAQNKAENPQVDSKFTPSTQTATNSDLLSGPIQGTKKTVREPDNTSISSSTTLHDEINSARTPDPATEIFHTPLQTPGLPLTAQEMTVPAVEAQDQVPNPKKKKSRKKKKGGAATVMEADQFTGVSGAPSGSNADSSKTFPPPSPSIDPDHIWRSDPFGGQMSHIDAIRKANEDPSSYYSQVNAEIAEKKMAEDVDEATKAPGKLAGKTQGIMDNVGRITASSNETEQTYWRRIQALLVENPSLLQDLNSPEADTKEDSN